MRLVSHATVECEGIEIPIELSIVFLGKEEIKKVNSERRAQNEATDVLSFSFLENKEEEREIPVKWLGEILVCPAVVREEIKGDEDFRQELARTLIHGLLHILGYNHKREEDFLKMKKKEKHYISQLF